MNRPDLYACAVAILLTLCLSACGEQRDATPAPPAESQRLEAPQEGGAPAATTSSASAPGPAEGPSAVPTANSPPVILSLKLEPTLVFPGTPVKVVVEASDPQNDPVTLDFGWEKNGEPLSGQIMDELDTTGMRKGDLITAVVTPADGQVRGESKRSRPVVILNRPPEITSFPTPALVEGVFTYAVKATDPDGDKLSFALEQAPPDMKIDADAGLVQWVVPKGPGGKVQVRIVVSDGDARAFQSFDLQLSTKPQ